MKKFSIFIVFIILSITAFAQAKPIYFRGNQVVNNANIATSYGVYGKIESENIWTLKKYSLYDELEMTGSYKDGALKIEHGNFVYYNDYRDFNYQNNTAFYLKDKTRYVAQTGRFENGLEVGKWMMFYPNGNLLNITTYVAGKKNGLFAYYDSNGNVIQTGNFVMDKKDGEWFYNRGKKREVYIMGVLQKENRNQSKASGTIN
ncbi:toxin-antitoxin system YwqK family antitoxin [Pedobacter sp. Hv1]|uniref:toxin-antitoxin system YwqK family antitoxin n=1 Tax=Pedobacter sp. Hv1 TaxID=1740090 RepID=UPI0006D8CCD4|nr:hypothetical protein [Pedobacter sp. Hv1]KQB98957.1 hypothetical protein AQF98_19705 [Pedobacter sp. Hv1]